MVSKSLTVLLLAAICIWQGTHCANGRDMISFLVDRMYDAVYTTLCAFKADVNKLESMAKKLNCSIQNKIRETEQSSALRNKQYVAHADSLDLETSKCIIESQERIEEAKSDGITGIRECLRKARSIMAQDMDMVGKEMKQIRNIHCQAANQMAKCWWFNSTCKNQVEAIVAKKVAAMTVQSAKDGKIFGEDFMSAQGEFEECALERANVVLSIIRSAYAEEGACLRELISEAKPEKERSLNITFQEQ